MLKNILNLEGAQKLSKNEQKLIKGAGPELCEDDTVCYHPKKCTFDIVNGVWYCGL